MYLPNCKSSLITWRHDSWGKRCSCLFTACSAQDRRLFLRPRCCHINPAIWVLRRLAKRARSQQWVRERRLSRCIMATLVVPTVTVSVPNAIRGDLNSDGIVDIDDYNLLADAVGTNAVGAFDARDLNADGVIDSEGPGHLAWHLWGSMCSDRESYADKPTVRRTNGRVG